MSQTQYRKAIASADQSYYSSLTMTPAYNAIPKFLAQTKYQNPTDKTPFNLAYNTDMPVFEWRKHNPENAKAGQAFMAAQRMGQRSVWDGKVTMTDFKLSEADRKDGRVMLVDVGGGMGHQCVDIRKHNPDIEGKFITQDLPFIQDMISNRDELDELNIETMPHDFMKEQPVKNAKIYYLRNVIHNCKCCCRVIENETLDGSKKKELVLIAQLINIGQDKPSKVILSSIKEAMASDSIVIIDDVVMPQVGASWKQTSMDIAMMTMLAAVERTADHFGRLLAEVGLEIRDIWTYDDEFGDSLIVAVPLGSAKTGQKRKSLHDSTNGHTNGYTNGHTNGHANGSERHSSRRKVE